jgi:prepilin-type N-terminal cleavage/methylation domain-containing protein
MNITPRDRKLLRIWPLLWPAFFYLIFRPHRDENWWTWFCLALAIVIAGFAGIKTAPLLWRIARRQRRVTVNSEPIATGRAGFSLIELLVVIAIIGILAAIVGPSIVHFSKGDKGVSATRQMLDDCARARALAISQRTTVYMVFVHTNFWLDPMRPGVSGNQWNIFATACPDIASSTTVTQLYSAQLTGYAMYSLRAVGDQPGANHPKDLLRVRTLPDNVFIAPIKFAWPPYPAAPFLIQTNFPMYGFARTNTIPFPTTEALTNANYINALALPGRAYPTVCYIAFNYLGQLTTGDGSLLPYDEYIPLSFGTLSPSKTQLPPIYTETPAGNSTNISFNLIHIDRLTGRARVEQHDSI